MKISQFRYFGKWQFNYSDDLRRLRRDAPATLQLPENSDPASQEAIVRMAVVPLHFHGSGANPGFMPVSTEQKNFYISFFLVICRRFLPPNILIIPNNTTIPTIPATIRVMSPQSGFFSMIRVNDGVAFP